MDKGSTVKMSGNEILKQGKLTIGMDLGDRSTRYCVLDQAGEVILGYPPMAQFSQLAFWPESLGSQWS